MSIHLSGLLLLVISIAILYIGMFITRHVRWLDEYNIPASVTGGLLFAAGFSILSHYSLLQMSFDLGIRDLFLLAFFASVGLSSRLKQLVSGGKTLSVLLVVVFTFIILQNVIGLSSALLLGLPPANGLLAGSIAFAGGHGTAITWSNYLSAQGYPITEGFGLLAATFGLILGGVLGGPVSHRLIKKHKLEKQQTYKTNDATVITSTYGGNTTFDTYAFSRVLLEIALAITFGTYINGLLKSKGLILPDFLLVLVFGIIITNITDILKLPSSEKVTNVLGETSLDLFVIMSLITLKLNTLSDTATPLVIISIVQSLFIIFFAYYIFFRFAGKDYDAAVMVSGFIGSGLGATPVGMANVETVNHHFGISQKALLLVPLLGSVCTDVMNAVILRFFLTLPVFGA